MRILSISLFAMLAACQTYGKGNEHPQSVQSSPAPATHQQVPMLVRATCAGCHAVQANMRSPLPDAPTFVEIANRDNLTKESLSAYLSDAHNYPDQMDVEIDSTDIEVIADYMLSLREAEYVRPPS